MNKNLFKSNNGRYLFEIFTCTCLKQNRKVLDFMLGFFFFFNLGFLKCKRMIRAGDKLGNTGARKTTDDKKNHYKGCIEMELGRLEKEACHSLQYFFLGETIRHFW